MKYRQPFLFFGVFFGLAFIIVSSEFSFAQQARIVGGDEATPGAYPFVAAIMDSSNQHYCGGTLIANKWVLSAAHCFVNDDLSVTPAVDIRVGLGIHDVTKVEEGTVHAVEQLIIHPSYDPDSFDNDFALLELAGSASQAPANLYFSTTSLVGETATAAGWGNTIPDDNNSGSDVLLEVDLPVVSNATCQQVYDDLTDNMLCAGFDEGGKDSCQGDSGGPLFLQNGANFTLIGVVSFGDTCAAPNSFGVYARVSKAENFITQYVSFNEALPLDESRLGLWNGYLSMVNILELVNNSNQTKTAQINIFSITGALVSSSNVVINAQTQQDVILNDLPGFVVNSYGIVQVSDNVEGRMFYYRPTSAGFSEFDFAFGLNLEEPVTGTSYVAFNTYNPSTNPLDANNLVANWLSLVNLENAEKSFTVRKYGLTGELLSTSIVTVDPMSRMDLEAGHADPGPNNVGIIRITPPTNSTRYLAQLTRYGYGRAGGFDFAFPLVPKPGASDSESVTIGNSIASQNWLEVVNTSGETNNISVKLYNAAGTLLHSDVLVLAGRSQQHINTTSFLGDEAIGLATVRSLSGRGVVSESMQYYRAADGSISSMYGSQSDNSEENESVGSFNLFLDMENYLKISNPNTITANVTVDIASSFSAGSSTMVEIPAQGSVELTLHDFDEYGTIANSYGTVTVDPVSSTPLIHEVLRIKRDDANGVQFGAPTSLED